MTAKLQHPWRRHRRRSDEGEEVLVFAEDDTATPAGAAPAAPGGVCLQHFVAAHDVGDLSKPAATERSREQTVDGGALRRCQICQPQALTLVHRARKVGPFRLLRSFEGELDLGSTRVVERRQQCLRGGDNTRRRVRGLAWRRSTALSDDCRSDGDEQAERDGRRDSNR